MPAREDGILLDNVSGDIWSSKAASSLALNQNGDPVTSAISIEGGDGDVTISATVVNSTGRSAFITGRTGGEIHLVTPIQHDVDGTSAIVIEDNLAGSTTFWRPLDIHSGSAAAVVESNNADHVVTFLTEGVPQGPLNTAVTFVDSGQLIGNLGNSASYEAIGVALGDLDGDGDLDAYVVNRNHALDGEGPDTGEPDRIYLNNGGIFTDSGQTLGNAIGGQVKLADFDNDGDLDAFVGNFGANQLWLNDGSGTFTDSGQTLGDGLSIDLAIGDVDGDGDLDAVVANFSDGGTPGGEVWVNQGLHTGTFVNSATTAWDTISAFGVALGDVDGDGDLDVFVSQGVNSAGHAGDEKLLLNQGDGTFIDSGQSLGASHSFGVVLEDFDSDGDLDAFVTGAREFPPGEELDGVRDPNRYFVNLGGAQGGTAGVFGSPVLIYNDNQDQARVAAADFDGDGDIDVFVANVKDTLETQDDGRNRVYVNQGGRQGGIEGTFADNGQQLGNSHSVGVAVGDVDGDGRIDAFVSNAGSPSRVWLNTSEVETYRTIDASPFERIEPLGSLVSVSGTEVAIAAGETVEFVVDVNDSQTLVGFVDSNSPTAAFTMELMGVSGVITGAAEGFVTMPLQQIVNDGTYTIRVTSNTATDIELVLILNAEFEADQSPSAPPQPIDAAFNGGASAGRWAAVGVTFPEAGPNDVDEFSVDLTGHVGHNIDVIVTGFEGQHFEDQTLELIAPDGTTVLATGTATPVGGTSAINFDLGILSFEVPADGVYTARITAPFDDVAYTLLVSYGLTFDTEPNNDRVNDSLRTIVPNDSALGYLDAASDADDFFEIELTAGAVVTLTTDFAQEAEFSPVNTLDPELEVFAPDSTSLISDQNSAGGVAAEVTFTAAETGKYVVRMKATSGSGEYLLRTDVSVPPALAVSIVDDSFSEAGGTAATTATVSRTGDTTAAVTVTLVSNDTTEATVIGSVTIAAGETTSAAFDISAVDDLVVDGTQTITIIASAAGHIDGADTVDVTDDDIAALTLTIADDSISEAGGTAATTATVTRNSDTTSALTVNLLSSDTTEATVVATVTIAAGQTTSDPFNIDAADDDEVDGTQTITITASGAGHTDGTDTVGVTDDDVARPAAPTVTGPSGTVGSTLPTFTWTAVHTATSYRLYVQLLGGDSNPVIDETISGTAFTASTALEPGQYRTWIQAFDANGVASAWSHVLFSISLAPVIHDLPLHGTTDTPTVTWNAIGGAAVYRVYIRNTTIGGSPIDEIVSTESFTPSTGLSFGRHELWVRAILVGGLQGPWSRRAEYHIGPQPIGPTGATLDARPRFEWSAINGAASYHLFVRGPGGVVINESGLTGTSFTPATDLVGGDYRWWLKPATANGKFGAWSEAAEFSTGGRTKVTIPACVTSGDPEITWPEVPGAQSYEIYLHKIGTPGAFLNRTGLTAGWYASPILEDGDYKVWIRTTLADGSRVWGGAVSFTVERPESVLSALPIGPVGPGFDTTPEFTWQAASEAVSYDIFLHDGNSVHFITGQTGTSFTLTIERSGEFTWAVRGVDSSGAPGPWSLPVAFNTNARVTLLTPGDSTSDTTPAITWTAVPGAVRYVIQVNNLTTSTTKVIYDENVTEASFTPATPLPAGEYRVWIRAISSDTFGSWSRSLDFTIVVAVDHDSDDADAGMFAALEIPATGSGEADVRVSIHRKVASSDASARPDEIRREDHGEAKVDDVVTATEQHAELDAQFEHAGQWLDAA
ncbi:MAG: FG-GAP-like repeat-containing protein [Planctomycetaceae bacterium]